MPRISESAAVALTLVDSLQRRFVDGLQRLASGLGSGQRFTPVEWLRDGGRHGGGRRFETGEGDCFWRGSVNVSQVQYDDMPEKRLGAASALSAIIHPHHPLAPSVHIHISRTEMKDGFGYWRMMADLNPAIENPEHTARFFAALQRAAPAQFEAAKAQGDRYFFIPALDRHRGVAHFYLEHYHTHDAAADAALAKAVGMAAIDAYLGILGLALGDAPPPTDEQRAAQLAYHTLYLFQVLTLDRGTTAGLLAHDQNDLGVMGSLPPCADRGLLGSWLPRMQPPQDELLMALVVALPDTVPVPIDETVKRRLAAVVRRHYTGHPEALVMQAAGDALSPTVGNHY